VRDLEGGAIAAALSFALTMSTVYYEEFTTSRLLIVLLLLGVVQVLRSPFLVFTREIAMYALLTAYLTVSLLWTPDPVLGLNSIFPALDFLVIAVSLASLVRDTDGRAVIVGTLAGLLAGALVFTVTTRFPLAIPFGFSYNAFAMLYFCGIFLTLLVGVLTRSRLLVLLLVVVLLAHVAATTSIKTNLGIILGALGVTVFYRRQAGAIVRRYALPIAIAVAALTYLALSNAFVVERMEYAYDRLTVGIEVLQMREDRAGYTGFNERADWMRAGLAAWRMNPVFGYGVEAFRVPFGITSHSTPVDLLYNSGLIGFCLFYAMLCSLGLRCIGRGASAGPGLRAVILFGVIVYLFVSLSGTIFYQSFLAVVVGIGSGLLHQQDRQEARA
jgi:O-antigen ligase